MLNINDKKAVAEFITRETVFDMIDNNVESASKWQGFKVSKADENGNFEIEQIEERRLVAKRIDGKDGNIFPTIDVPSEREVAKMIVEAAK